MMQEKGIEYYLKNLVFNTKGNNLKEAASNETALDISDRSHDIPTRKRIITCASSDMQQPINGMED